VDKFIIQGPTPLQGTIPISGSKNAALPLMAAAILGSSPTRILNVPKLKDIYTFNKVMRATGADVRFDEEKNTLIINPEDIKHTEAPYELVRKMRASFYMLGALAGKYGHAKVSLPGGCAWGPRPVDLHLNGMRAMGVDIELKNGYVHARVPKKLNKTTFTLKPSSVGATINLILVSVLRAKKFVLKNAAQEPDVVLLCETLQKMGANIEGAGTDTLTIYGVESLEGLTVSNAPDRIETGTFMIAGALHPDSELTLKGANPDELGDFPKYIQQAGINCNISGDEIRVSGPSTITPVSVETAVYPGFPTDLQAQWCTMMTQAAGSSAVTDTIYYDRFSYVPELVRLGADISVTENKAVVSQKTTLKGTTVMSTDLRASVSLVLAGLIAQGTTEVLRIYHLDRGYEDLGTKLTNVGARIRREEQ
jgi:UDP-N-acetylglucosamine 1-carboxyvinyltransferase